MNNKRKLKELRKQFVWLWINGTQGIVMKKEGVKVKANISHYDIE